MTDPLLCAARVNEGQGRWHTCRVKARYWADPGYGVTARPVCGTHANTVSGPGVRLVPVITGSWGRDKAWAEDGDLS